MGQRFFYRAISIVIFVVSITCFDTQAQFAKYIDKPKVAAVPLITYNRSYGGIFGAFGTLYFPINKLDTLSPASSVGAGGMIYQ